MEFRARVWAVLDNGLYKMWVRSQLDIDVINEIRSQLDIDVISYNLYIYIYIINTMQNYKD